MDPIISRLTATLPLGAASVISAGAPAAGPTATAVASTSGSPAISAGSNHQAMHAAGLAALGGSPEALIAMVTRQLRESQSRVQANGVEASYSHAETAERERERLMEAARRAAEEASGFLGLSGIFGDIAKIAGVVAAVAATVATGGAAAVVAGALLIACADPLCNALADAGVISPEAARALSTALKVTGAIMLGGPALGSVAAAGIVLSSYSGEVAGAMVDAGIVPEDARGGLTTAFAIGGAAVTVAATGGAGGSASASNAVSSAARAVEVGADIGAAGTNVAGAELNREAAGSRADAKVQSGRSDDALQDGDQWIDALKQTMRRTGRAMAALREIEAARAEARRSIMQRA